MERIVRDATGRGRNTREDAAGEPAMDHRWLAVARALPVLLGLLATACGGAPMPAEDAHDQDEAYVPRMRTARRRRHATTPATEATAKAQETPAATPAGAPGSYEEALRGATSGADDEVLPPSECARPITSSMVMDCGVSGSVSVRLAIQNGRLIGVSADSQPHQPRVEACVQRRARAYAWRKTAGLTTCTRSFKIEAAQTEG